MNGTSNISDQALQDYLDDLLLDSFVRSEPAQERIAPVKLAAAANVATLPLRPSVARPFAEPIRTLNLRLPLPPLAAEPMRSEVPVEIKPAPVETVPPAPLEAQPVTPVVEADAGPAGDAPASPAQMREPAAWLANGRPQWAQQPFECLLFRSGGLMLAAPLVELGSIYPLQADSLTSVFGQSSWFIGLLPLQEYNARAIDTAMVVMPERYQPVMREDYRYLITLFGSDWGLAVDEIVSSVVLDPDQVRWRGQRSKRPWLAGTVVEQMCALLDIAQLAWMFHSRDGKRQPIDPA